MSIHCVLYLIAIINCVILINGYPSDYKNEKCLNYCSNGGICLMDDGNPQCYCLPEWKGERCDSVREYIRYDIETYKPIARSSLRTHPCAFAPADMCMNDGFCELFNNSLFCACPHTYIGKRCEEPSPCNTYCQNGGICTIENDEPVCNCTGTGFSGTICSKYITIPPGSTTADPRCALYESFCSPGKCVITNGVFSGCQCPPTHTGRFCETVVGAATNPLPGTIVTASPTMGPIVTASPTFGPIVTASPTFGPIVTASPTLGPIVTASPTFGPIVTASPTVPNPIPGRTCRDSPCQNGGQCFNTGNSYYCYCGPQFIGIDCQIRVG